MHGQDELLLIVGALRDVGRLAHLLHGGDQQPDQIAMMAITTSNSISVKAGRRFSKA